MKKNYLKEIKVIRGAHFSEVSRGKEWPDPFDEELLEVLKEENRFEQEYVYLQRGESYALLTMYRMKLNLFTFGKLNWRIWIKVIGYPCSLSNGGYVTNDMDLVLRYAESIKGAKLILNATEPMCAKQWSVGETLPTCVFTNRFQSVGEYMTTLRSSYRRRIRKALKACKEFTVREGAEEIDIYPLYLNTYEKSGYKLEKLEAGFFSRVDGIRLVFLKGDEPRGFVLLKHIGDTLVFMLCGMDYRYDTADLYYFMLYTILGYGITCGVKRIDLGQTSEETKLKLGAVPEKRYFYAHHSNPVINRLVQLGKDLLAYHYCFPEYRVFMEEKHESIVGETGI